jgi:mannose-1-phosphate guanylyltransferase
MVVYTVCPLFLFSGSKELMTVFDRSLFDEIKVAMDDKLTRAAEDPLIKQDENLQLEQDVIVPLAASRKVYVFETTDFWRQMKTAAYVPSLFALGWADIVAPR